MACSLNFGRNGRVELNPPDGARTADNLQPTVDPIEDPAEAVSAALREPLDFPPLEMMVLPDDEVAIALEPGVASAPQLIAGVIQSLLEVGVPPELIRIVRAENDPGVTDKQLLSKIDSGTAGRIQLTHHDASNREALGFLGASKDDHPIYINRTLCDAAVVIPIGTHRNEHDPTNLGVHHAWFPVFADEETQRRFTKSLASRSEKKIEKRSSDCEEAGWILGVQMVVTLVPAGDGQVLHVIAGEPNAVKKRATELSNDVWRVNVENPVGLVVAGIGGGPEQQTWENVVRAIDTALKAVETDGAIAVCSEVKEKLGPALQRLAGAETFESAEQAIQKKAARDSFTASRLNHALQRARIYFLSNIGESEVEGLGMAYVANPGEVAKLSTQYDSCLMLQNAQHVSITHESKVDA